MVQWLRLHKLSMQGAGVQSLVRELDPTCCNQMPQPTPHNAVKIWCNQYISFKQNLFFTVLEARKLKSRCWHICCVVRAHLLGHRWQFYRLWWKGQGSRLRPLRRVLIPLGKPCPHELITFQRLHHLRIRISQYKFCWDTNIWSVALCEL